MALDSGEAAALGLLKAGFLPLGRDLLDDPRIQSRSRRLAARGRPVTLCLHGLDQFLAGHRLTGLGQDLGGAVQSAKLLRLRFSLGGFGRGPLELPVLMNFRCCHDTSPYSWGLRISGGANIARFLRFRQVLPRAKNLRDSPTLALRWALLRASVNSVGLAFRVLAGRSTICT